MLAGIPCTGNTSIAGMENNAVVFKTLVVRNSIAKINVISISINSLYSYSDLYYLVVSTHLKNISQNGNLPQMRLKMKIFELPPPSKNFRKLFELFFLYKLEISTVLITAQVVAKVAKKNHASIFFVSSLANATREAMRCAKKHMEKPRYWTYWTCWTMVGFICRNPFHHVALSHYGSMYGIPIYLRVG